MQKRLLLPLIGVLSWRLSRRLIILLNGFLAKHICSAIFISGRNLEEVKKHELKIGLFRFPKIRVDYKRKCVSVGLWGWRVKHAYYHPERGCALCSQPPAVSPATSSLTQSINLNNPGLSTALKPILKPWIETVPSQTLAVYIMQKGEAVAEWYAPGIGRDTPLPGWSMAKSVVNALVGILVRQGKADLHAPLPADIWQGKADNRQHITLHHLLQMSSGLPWGERYWWDSDVTRMLFDSDDASSIITSKPYGKVPGTYWQYASGTTNVISKAMRYLLGKDYHHFPYRALFAPLGMHTALLETDACGNFVASSYMLASAADWAKFGQLYLQDGVWREERILPEGWVDYSIKPAASALQRQYGAHFWLNLGIDGQRQTRKMPDVPAEVYYASGFGGQRVFIVPSRELVIVRLGAAHFREPDFNHLLSTLLADY